MNLQGVTITGADDEVPQWELYDISKEHPFVEWAILASKSSEGKPRYPSRKWQTELQDIHHKNWPIEVVGGSSTSFFNLALHICGRWIKDLLVGNVTIPDEYIPEYARIQFNFRAKEVKYDISKFVNAVKKLGNSKENPLIEKHARYYIFQLDENNQNACFEECLEYGGNSIAPVDIFPLFDGSGGTGITPKYWPKPIYSWRTSPYFIPHGYAGGLGPHNLEEQLVLIEEASNDTPIWIDMESGVRTDNKFDLEKVVKCLQICKPFIK